MPERARTQIVTRSRWCVQQDRSPHSRNQPIPHSLGVFLIAR
jgi:hypothetical protein